MSESYDSIVIGAGAAGLFYAFNAGKRGKKVLLLEHAPEPGAKILISGGGRCNFTNLHTKADRFLSNNPHFARSALSRYTPSDFIALVEKHGIKYYEKTLGQLFGEGKGAAHLILRMLLDECQVARATMLTDCRVRDVRRREHFVVETDRGQFEAPALVIATGGLSIPKIGATDFAYRIARQFGVPIIEPRPGLVPLTFCKQDLEWMSPLSGISAPVTARSGLANFDEGALFTHRGLSGPAILQTSSYWTPGGDIEIDWLPECAEDFLTGFKRDHPKAHIKAALSSKLSARFADELASRFAAAPLIDQKNVALIDVMRALKAWRLTPSGSEGYAKAEVTVGGVDTEALSQKTMEVKTVPGLFFIGEAVDVTGWLGGYNFQWAWASAFAAATA
ncbi:MAG: NAD(P)/FAD-dependent oxidoreductase [Caulobacterales bacterium]